jgi:iron complex outermembrane receptor protein
MIVIPRTRSHYPSVAQRIGLPLWLSLTTSTVALAQATQPVAQATVEDVVVSAPEQTITQQQIEKVQSSPVTATVVTQKQLEAAQITDLQGAQKLEPSLNIKFGNVRNIAINVRGFGASSSSATDAIFGGTPVYLNGVYQPFVGQAVFNIPDLVGIEVLKGPQATAGGQDNTGGVVNITTALPSFTPGQNFEFQYGRFNEFQEKASITGPIAGSDWAAFRLSFFDKDQEGYLLSTTDGNRYNGQHSKGGMAQFLLTPQQDLTALITANYSTVTQGCCISGFAGAITNYTNGTAIPNNFYTRAARAGIPVPAAGTFIGTYTTNGMGWQQTAQDTYQLSAKVDYTFNGYNLESVTAGTAWDFHPHNGYSATPGVVYLIEGQGSQIDAKAVTQDIKISSPKGSPVEVTAGTFFLWDLLIDHARTGNGANGPLAGAFNGSTSITGFTPAQVTAINNAALNYLAQTAYDNPTTTEIAPYIQDVWHATSNLDITTGVRYSYYYKNSRFFQYFDNLPTIPAGFTAAQAAAVTALQNSSKGAPRSWDVSTHQGIVSALGTATYKFTPDVFGYVTVSQGGRAGGPNPATGNLPTTVPITVAAERLDNFEVGFKSSWFDQKLTANLATFVMVDHNYIVPLSSQLGSTTTTYLSNAKLADSRGVELDIRTNPIEGLNTYTSLTYDDTYYASFSNAACPLEVTGQVNCNITGKPLSNTPRWTFVSGGEYSKPLASFLPEQLLPANLMPGLGSPFVSGKPFFDKPLVGYAGADFTWQSQYFSDTTDSVYTIVHPYGLLDVHAGIKFDDNSWDLSMWGHNVLNKHYYTAIAAATSGGLITATVGDPVEYGVTLRAKF